MKAKGAFVVAGLLAAAGIALMLMSVLGASELQGYQGNWSSQLTRLRGKITDEAFPSNPFIASRTEHGRQLQGEIGSLSRRVAKLRHRLTADWFPTAPAGDGDPSRFNIAWKEARDELLTRYASMTQEMEWGNTKKSPIPAFDNNPRKEDIAIWQAKFWITEGILKALARHAVHQETTATYENKVVLREGLIEHKEDASGASAKGYDTFTVTLKGLIPYPILARAIADLSTVTFDEQDQITSENSILYSLKQLEVKRSLPDPEKTTIEYYPHGTTPAARETAAPLQNEVTVVWEVRLPRAYVPPSQ